LFRHSVGLCLTEQAASKWRAVVASARPKFPVGALNSLLFVLNDHHGAGFLDLKHDQAEQLQRQLILQVRRDVRVVEGACLEIALAVCDGVLQISITVAKPTS